MRPSPFRLEEKISRKGAKARRKTAKPEPWRSCSAPLRLCVMLFSPLLVAITAPAIADEPVRLKESFPAGYHYRVSGRTELTGKLTLPMSAGKSPGTLVVSGESAIEYHERIVDGDERGPVEKSIRFYRRLDFQKKLGEQSQQLTLRPQARRLILLRLKQSEVPFSPDGPLTWGEIDAVRTDVFTPALAGLLPEQAVKVGDEWTAHRRAVSELTDLAEITDGRLICKLQEVTTRNGRRVAQVTFAGTVRGSNEDGANEHQLKGHYHFDLQSNHLSYLYLDGVSAMLNKDGNAKGRIEGRFVLTRKLEPTVAELSDAAIRSLTLIPTADNTALLFDEPALGVSFTYPRRWTVQRADARQIVLDEPQGGGLVITLEPLAQTPSGAQFHAEASAILQQRSATVLRSTQPKPRPNGAEHFEIEAEIDLQRLLLDYQVLRQGSGGAVLAGRFPFAEAASLQRDAERIAGSLRLIPPKK